MREYLMEFIGAMFLVLVIGLSGNALAIGLILMTMVYIGGHISGAHYNPAVSLSVWMRGKLKTDKLFGYMASQVLGTFIGALIVYSIMETAFAPARSSGVTMWQAILVEAFFTFALCFVILTVATTKKFEGNYVYGLAIGLTLAAGAFAGGSISGGAYNPAVALGPMILRSMVAVQNWDNLIVYLIGPFLGSVIAAQTFKYLNPKEI